MLFSYILLLTTLSSVVATASTCKVVGGCSAGQFCDPQNGCMSCQAGFFQSGTGITANSCAPCPAGSYSQNGASTCIGCSPGSYTNNAQSACQLAQGGTYVPGYNGTDVTKCPPRYFQVGTGKSYCDICPCGTFDSNWGATNCQSCSSVNNLPATTNPGALDQTDCFNAGPGTYLSSSTRCATTCPAGTYSSSSASQSSSGCTACSDTTQWSPAGATACSTCTTPGTRPNTDHSTCTAIPTGGLTSKRRIKQCAQGKTACAVLGGATGAFECIDTSSDITSCGGCWNDDSGEDCTIFDENAEASCVAGKCRYKCPAGWKLTSLGCVKPRRHQSKFTAFSSKGH